MRCYRGDAVNDPRSMSYQASCIREQLHKEADPMKRAGLEGAIATIEKLIGAREPIKALVKVLDVFPDATVTVRRIGEAAE